MKFLWMIRTLNEMCFYINLAACTLNLFNEQNFKSNYLVNFKLFNFSSCKKKEGNSNALNLFMSC